MELVAEYSSLARKRLGVQTAKNGTLSTRGAAIVERVVTDCATWLRRYKRCSLYALCLKGPPRDVSSTLAKYCSGTDPDPLKGCRSPGLVVSLLKAALESLQAPLVPGDLHDRFLGVHEVRNPQRRVRVLQNLVDLLPRGNLAILRGLMGLLHDVYTFEAKGFPSAAVQTVRSIASHFEDSVLRPGHMASAPEERIVASVVTCIMIQEYKALFDRSSISGDAGAGTAGGLGQSAPNKLGSSSLQDAQHQQARPAPQDGCEKRGGVGEGEENNAGYLKRGDSGMNLSASSSTTYESATLSGAYSATPRTPPSPTRRASRRAGLQVGGPAASSMSPPEVMSSPTGGKFGGIPKSPHGHRLGRMSSDGADDSFVAEVQEDLEAIISGVVAAVLTGPHGAMLPRMLPKEAPHPHAAGPGTGSGLQSSGAPHGARRSSGGSGASPDPLSYVWLEPKAKSEIIRREIAELSPQTVAAGARAGGAGRSHAGENPAQPQPAAAGRGNAAPQPTRASFVPAAADDSSASAPPAGEGARARVVRVPVAHLKSLEDGGLAVSVGPERFVISGAYLRAPSVSSLTYDQLREEKNVLKRELKRIDDDFADKIGRKPTKVEKEVLRSWYIRYFKLKQALDKLELVHNLHGDARNGS